ncbi:hypothetical protein [Pleionea litopenaei]|uniref:Uncharacterized protein n=1 Tax=Pleionea litopenaei TaxID=3070815 RepID=A0AA51RV95_9GAMM|nr:hypothetical protein [Pleionea sp. HL-JVS1]WMS88276.1 hypothetical protein Q9312_05000 [Pleionea sp. HL-JVS1]
MRVHDVTVMQPNFNNSMSKNKFNDSTMYQAPTSETLNASQREANRHSKLGILSFIFSLLAVIICLMSIVYVGYLVEYQVEPTTEEDEILVGFGFLFSGLLFLVGFTLGILGLLQKEKRRVFAILSVSISSIFLLFIVFLIVLGVLAD